LKERECNRKFVLTATAMSGLDYDLAMLELGCQFAENLYPVKTRFEMYQKLIKYSPGYWVWWQAEWAKWEREMIVFTKTNQVPLDYNWWHFDTLAMIESHHIEASYNHNFLKNSNLLM